MRVRSNYSQGTRSILLYVLILFSHFYSVGAYAQPCDCTYDQSPCQTTSFNVFISYSGYDREIVNELTTELHSRNVPYWDYQESCAIGSNCDLGNIKAVIADSELIVIIRSESWNGSEMCKMEKEFIEAFKSKNNTDNVQSTEDLLNKIFSYYERFPQNYKHVFIDYWTY